MSIKSKLIITFFIVTAFPAIGISYVNFYASKQVLEKVIISKLTQATEVREGEIFLFLEQLKRSAITVTTDWLINGLVADVALEKQLNRQQIDQLNRHLTDNKLPVIPHLLSIQILDRQGAVMASTHPQIMGLNQAEKDYFKNSLQGEASFVFEMGSEYQVKTIYLSYPIKNKHAGTETAAVLVNQYNANMINTILAGQQVLDLGARTQDFGLGQTAITYLVNENMHLMSPFFIATAPSPEQLVDTYPVKQAFENNQEVQGTWMDYQGQEVVGASMILEVGGTKWILISEMSTKEAFASIERLNKQQLFFVSICAILAALLAYLIAVSFSTPIIKLTEQLNRVSRGRYGQQIGDIKNNDEIGFMAHAFNEMSRNLSRSQSVIEKKNRELSELCIKDGLTKIFNHRYLAEFVNREFERSDRYDLHLGCVLFDIDRFKSINDEYGHPFGDYVITEISRLLSIGTRKTDAVGRYGGEEFLTILSNTNLENSYRYAEKTRKRIESHRFSKKGISIHVTVSAGVAAYESRYTAATEMIADADKALYRAKQGGRNRACIYKDLLPAKTT